MVKVFLPKKSRTRKKTIKKNPHEIVKRRKIDPKDGEKDDDGFWKCNLCTKRFDYRKQLVEHVTDNHKSECPDKYVCSVCGRGFRKEPSYRHHMETHQDKSFPCLECSKVYPTKLSLYIHIKFLHKKVDLITCETCGRGFKTKTSLTKHINVVHKKMRRFKCLTCESRFGSKSIFKTHCKLKHQAENKEAAERMLKLLSEKEGCEG